MSAPIDVTTGVRDALARITEAWRRGTPEAMAPLLHENIVTALPDFVGRVEGRDPFIAGFRAFSYAEHVREYETGDVQVDGDGNTAVAQYPFRMIYEREGGRWLSTGWDVWAFTRNQHDWVAVWRTMQAIAETPADVSP